MLLFLQFFLFASNFSKNTGLYSDWTLHITVFDELKQTWYIPTTYSNLLEPFWYPRFEENTIYHPSLYYLKLYLIDTIFKADKINYYFSIYAWLLILFFAVIIYRRLWISSIFLLLLLSLQILYFNWWDQDIVVWMYGVIIFYLLSFHVKNIIPIVILLVAMLWTKQTWYPFVWLCWLYLVFFFIKNKNFSSLLLLVISGFLLYIPIFSFEVANKWTILSSSLNFEKNFLWFTPNFTKIDDWQISLDKNVDLDALRENADWAYLKRNPIKSEILSIRVFWLFLWVWWNEEYIYIIALLILLSIILKYKNLTNIQVLLLAVGVFFSYYFWKVQYNLFVIIYIYIIFSSLLWNILKKNKLFILMTVSLLFLIGYVSVLKDTIIVSEKINNQIEWGSFKIIPIGNFFSDTYWDKPLRIMTPKTIESPYYFNNEVFWDYRLSFIEDETYLKDLIEEKYKPTHVILYSNWLINDKESRNDRRQFYKWGALMNYLENQEVVFLTWNVTIFEIK